MESVSAASLITSLAIRNASFRVAAGLGRPIGSSLIGRQNDAVCLADRGHAALLCCRRRCEWLGGGGSLRSGVRLADLRRQMSERLDRKSTRLNSSHGYNSYAVFCL